MLLLDRVAEIKQQLQARVNAARVAGEPDDVYLPSEVEVPRSMWLASERGVPNRLNDPTTSSEAQPMLATAGVNWPSLVEAALTQQASEFLRNDAFLVHVKIATEGEEEFHRCSADGCAELTSTALKIGIDGSFYLIPLCSWHSSDLNKCLVVGASLRYLRKVLSTSIESGHRFTKDDKDLVPLLTKDAYHTVVDWIARENKKAVRNAQ